MTEHAMVAYFTEVAPDEATLRLAAAVVCRGVPTDAALQGGGGLLDWPRSARYRLWLRLGPMGADVSVSGRPLFGGMPGARRGVIGAGVGPLGKPLAYYDDSTRVLRILGRVVPAPPDRTLIALVDAAGPRAGAPRLDLRVVAAPPIPVPRWDVEPLEDAGGGSYMIAGEHPVWTEALRADPVVAAFLDGVRSV